MTITSIALSVRREARRTLYAGCLALVVMALALDSTTLAAQKDAANLPQYPAVIMPETSIWRYTTNAPGIRWTERKFNDRAWAEGEAGFGNGGALGAGVRTSWSSGQIWLRRTVKFKSVPANPQFALEHRGDVQVYLNGKLVTDQFGNTPRFVPIPIQGEAQASLRKGENVIAVLCACIGDAPFVSLRIEDAAPSGSISSPIYRDPRFDGAADPMVVWNRQDHCWMMFYTQRRANVKYLANVGYCYGSDIGMAVSNDGGQTWIYTGEAQGLEYKGGRNTFWAPEVFYAKGEYHMYVSYISGVHLNWEGTPIIVHFTSQDLKHWAFVNELPMRDVIDACVFPLPSGGWRLFYKQNNHTFAVDSQDLREWTNPTPAVTEVSHEGPNVFRWKDHYWMIVDVWHGQKVYRSDDLKTWTAQDGDTILGTPGKRRDDAAFGRHADVVVQGERAFIVYFTHPGGDTDHGEATSLKRTSVHVAELEYKDGSIVCDRDKPLKYKWDPALLDW